MRKESKDPLQSKGKLVAMIYMTSRHIENRISSQAAKRAKFMIQIQPPRFASPRDFILSSRLDQSRTPEQNV